MTTINVNGPLTLDETARHEITVVYTADLASTNKIGPVLTWGGHIARNIDWTFADPSGSPYHMRFSSWTCTTGDCSAGQQDLALSSAAVIPDNPAIEILKQISVDGGVTFFDANQSLGAPPAAIGSGALYRITVTNAGTADLVGVVVNDATLGIVNFVVGDLAAGATVVLTEVEIPELDQPGRCQVPGDVTNIATVDGQSADTGNTVSDSDPAVVRCVAAAAGFIVIDEDGIDNGLLYWLGNVLNPGPNNGKQFKKQEVNDHKAAEGLRDALPFFENNVGDMFHLKTGQVGDEGWFAPQFVPPSWDAFDPGGDGLRAFVDGVVPQHLLDEVLDVTPLRATGLKALEGGTFCAVVYDSDVSINYGPLQGNLQGANLGIAAFHVEIGGVRLLEGFSSGTLPSVLITVLDPVSTCGGPLELVGVPKPPSASEPFDIDPDNPTGGYL